MSFRSEFHSRDSVEHENPGCSFGKRIMHRGSCDVLRPRRASDHRPAETLHDGWNPVGAARSAWLPRRRLRDGPCAGQPPRSPGDGRACRRSEG